MTSPVRAAAVLVAAALMCTGLAACGGDSDADQAEKPGSGFSAAADLSTCSADAKAAPEPYGDGFPVDWPFPADTVVFNTEDRGADGTIVTGVSTADFDVVLASLNDDVSAAGFTNEKGETEEDDAESEWDGHGFHGRWAIRKSSQCPGETVIQVLSAAD